MNAFIGQGLVVRPDPAVNHHLGVSNLNSGGEGVRLWDLRRREYGR